MIEIITSQSVKIKLENKKYVHIPQEEFIISKDLIPYKKMLGKDWGNLGKDHYLKYAAGFRYRRFRYFYFLPDSRKILPFAATPYYQPPSINKYAGGIDRTFDSISNGTINNSFFRELIQFDFEQLPVLEESKSNSWLVDIHQIRIVATADEIGEPTPEGIHHDENDFGWIHLINRENLTGGLSRIYTNDKVLLDELTLRNNMDSIVIWDPKVMRKFSKMPVLQ